MSNKQKKNLEKWLLNLYYVGTLLTLFFIMAQVFFARRAVIQSSEWEKAKLTIENIERFKENLKETALYGKTEALMFGMDAIYPDLSSFAGWEATDTLRRIYYSFFDDPNKMREDVFKTIDILDAFSYPIIMGYASEFGSFQNVMREYYSHSVFIMPICFRELPNIGLHAQLLNRLWKVRMELYLLPKMDVEYMKANLKNLRYFEGTEITPATLKQYESNLKMELKKIQKEIEEFRKSSLK